jgi:hypothetical protein
MLMIAPAAFLIGGCPFIEQSLDGRWKVEMTGPTDATMCVIVQDGVIDDIEPCTPGQSVPFGLVYGIHHAATSSLGPQIIWVCELDYIPGGDAVLTATLIFDLVLQLDGTLSGTLTAANPPAPSSQWQVMLTRK